MPFSTAEKSLRRVLLISALHGWMITLFSGLFTVLLLFLGEWLGVAVGALVTAGGIFELRGNHLLKQKQIAGLSWLGGGQLLVLGTIWVYCLGSLITYDEAAIMAQFTPEMRESLAQIGMSMSDLTPLMKTGFFAFYSIVMGVTLLYLGGLALYCHTRRPQIAALFAGDSGKP